MNTNTIIETAPKTFTEGSKMNEALEAVGENLGKFKAYDSQLPIAEITGTRIVKCLYQVSPKTGKKLQENSYVRIPIKHLSEEHIVSKIASLSPYVLTWLQELEAKQIKELHSKGMLQVHCETLSLDKLIEALEESEAGSRLNKEKIKAWFIAEVQNNLAVLFAAKMGFTGEESEESLQKLEKILVAYCAKFESLAGGKTFIAPEECEAMIAVIEKCEASNSLLGSRFVARLQGMKEAKNEKLLAL